MVAGQYKVSRTIRRLGWMHRVTLLSVMGVALCVVSQAALAQQQPAPQQPAPTAVAPAQAAPRPRPNIGSAADRAAKQKGPVIDDSFSVRKDGDLYQLEEATALIAASLGKVSDRVGTLAINSFYFGKDVDPDFQRKAEIIILDKVFAANPDVLLVQCAECQKLETKIVNGVLKLRKGIPNAEARRELAKKLNADGFIDIGMFRDNKQLTVYLKVTEAESGAIILVDELVGRQAPSRDAYTASLAEFTLPLKFGKSERSHTVYSLLINNTVQLAGRFSFGVDLGFFGEPSSSDKSSSDIVLNGGAFLAPSLKIDVLRFPSSTSRLVYYLGASKLFAPQLSYGTYGRTGFEWIVQDWFVMSWGFNVFPKTKVVLTSSQKSDVGASSGSLEGTGHEFRIGLRW